MVKSVACGMWCKCGMWHVVQRSMKDGSSNPDLGKLKEKKIGWIEQNDKDVALWYQGLMHSVFLAMGCTNAVTAEEVMRVKKLGGLNPAIMDHAVFDGFTFHLSPSSSFFPP